ncbi:hypothetical protein [Nitrosovibrio tenuis]|uniref:Uncharacterized protein n=1 Tax=Nitrosovibrio tenuis TaxID=1233 RepID=A0A1H7IU30_9PROT|nr:hypothetical protein [Nitrosovibrio tenuis]SEK64295.1 hypothetical protein SAMN05216387_102252 [Nitrosovibrio tenuis]
MPQVKYIGATVKTDSINGIGLRWHPGQVRNVTAEVAERLFIYTDTWLGMRDEQPVEAEPIGLAHMQKPVEEPLPVFDFHGMGKDALVTFAQREYNERLDKRLSETTLRHKVIALFGKHQAEAE